MGPGTPTGPGPQVGWRERQVRPAQGPRPKELKERGHRSSLGRVLGGTLGRGPLGGVKVETKLKVRKVHRTQ